MAKAEHVLHPSLKGRWGPRKKPFNSRNLSGRREVSQDLSRGNEKGEKALVCV